MCTHKLQGGLGFRNLKKMNLALLTKTSWLLIHSPNDMWVQILRCKYFKNYHPLHYKKPWSMSWAWSSIFNGLDILKQHAHWDIKDGSTVNAFSEKWIQNSSQPLCVSYPNPNYKVAEFINHESKNCKTELIESLFTSENNMKICSMRIPTSGSDTLIWNYNKNGILTVKYVYKLLDNELPHNSSPNPDFDTHKALWKSQILPRTRLFIWKIFENILPAGHKLARLNHNHDERCKSCNSGASETIEHMLFHCSFAKNVWSNILVVSHSVLQDSDSNISIKNWISKWLVTKTLQDKSVNVLTTAWCIWKYSCSKLFDNKHLNSQITARNALRIVDETINALTPVPVPNITNVAIVNDSSFLDSVSQNCLLIYCDASFDNNSNDSGVGIVAINSSGEFKGCKLVSEMSSCSEADESAAILEAASWIKKNNF
ncbi:uncharacterized protein LOC113315506 [Papaver somniferum]|uniref:uncharacterized protein LOC113315506 n=1 Tax=Papaver somniferum TaxID=3469 RepID=UPI000E6FE6D6|nr:uncharacterized protein LOC113315506 [Papaver somniferum]